MKLLTTFRLWCVALTAAAAIVVLSPSPAHADDDPFAGRWGVSNNVTGESWVVEIRPIGDDQYAGRVVEKSPDSPLCWPVGEDVIHVSGSGTHFEGTATLYDADSQCATKVEPARIVMDVDQNGTVVRVTLNADAGCLDCEPETWARAGPLEPATPEWLIPVGVAFAAAVVALTIALVVVMRPSARARRRAKRQPGLPPNVTLHPWPGQATAPVVQVPDVPGISIRIEPRIELGEPFVQEASR